MPKRSVRFEATPNPLAVKCLLDPPVPGPTRSLRAAPAPGPDPLADALFAVPGVVGLLIYGSWITVSKSPDAPWPAVRAGVERVLSAWS